MKRMGLILAAALVVGGYLGCQRAGSDDQGEKLDQINKKLDQLSTKIDNIKPGAAAARPKRPPGPDPKKVYAAPIEGAAYKGPATAKVTIVDAFEYA